MKKENVDTTAREKHDTLDRFLDGEYALLHIAPQTAGLNIPPHLLKSETVSLKVSRHFRGHMEITRNEIKAELLFGDDYFKCQIPFDAVWGLTSSRGQFLMWPESAPPEVLASLEQQSVRKRVETEIADALEGVTTPEPTPHKRPVLKRIK